MEAVVSTWEVTLKVPKLIARPGKGGISVYSVLELMGRAREVVMYYILGALEMYAAGDVEPLACPLRYVTQQRH